MQTPLVLISLNVLYEPSISEESPYHFIHRWPAIQEALKGADIIHLQEVHESFLARVRAFATSEGYEVVSGEYHSIRKTHLASLVRPHLLVSSALHSIAKSHNKAISVQVKHEGRLYTAYNVHFPLDIGLTGERLLATRAVVAAAAENRNAIILGDWNTLPPRDGKDRGDAQQMAVARESGVLVPWDHGGSPEATYWGYPLEKEETIRGYASLATLDRLFVTPGVNVLSAECDHRFISIGGVFMAISDHMPCVVHFN